MVANAILHSAIIAGFGWLMARLAGKKSGRSFLCY